MVKFHRGSRTSRSGFTVIELLVVIAVIIVLTGLLLAGLRAATGAARDADSKSRFRAIAQALAAFQGDHGYFPPILRGGLLSDRNGPAWSDVVPNPSPTSDYSIDIQSWYSMTALPEYLLGAGGRDIDGYGQYDGDSNSTTERPALGIRSPGSDGAWGSTLYASGPNNNLPVGAALQEDRLRAFYVDPDANPFSIRFRRPGPVYGPYLGLEQAGSLGKILPSNATWSVNDQEPEPVQLITENDLAWTDPAARLVMLDSYGNPIEYFRSPYAPGQLSKRDVRDFLGGPDLPDDSDYQPSTLADVIRLRPFTFTADESVDGDGTGAFDSRLVDDLGPEARDIPGSTTLALKTARWALFSGGADKTYNPWVRSSELNEDNIVEIGK